MWEPLLQPGLGLIHGQRGALRGFAQELAQEALQRHPGSHVLWCDGDHGFDPYEFAELNLVRGRAADDGADRLLVKRCMTPFQWDSVLNQHLPEKLAEVEASLTVVAPFDRLWTTDELSDWEAEDYVRHTVPALARLAREQGVPILLFVDMAQWWKARPALAQATHDGASVRWTITRLAQRWRAVRDDGHAVDPLLRRAVTLLDFAEEALPLPPIEIQVARRTRPAAPVQR